MRTVGILGGMGPEATVLLMRKVIAATPAADDADHVPLIVDQNPQVPSRLRYLLDGTGDDPAPVLAMMARRLEAAGAQALAMPCNTAHHFVGAIRAASPLPFLDMVALSAAHARDRAGEGAVVGVLASPAVRRIGLFDRALEVHGLTAAYADDAPLLAAIRAIKAQGATPAARAAMRDASDQVIRAGAAVQMIACTELSLVAEAVAPQIGAFDTLDILTSAILSFARNEAQAIPGGRPGS